MQKRLGAYHLCLHFDVHTILLSKEFLDVFWITQTNLIAPGHKIPYLRGVRTMNKQVANHLQRFLAKVALVRDNLTPLYQVIQCKNFILEKQP